jgi:predicted HTH transcriptional regulator
MLLFEIGMVFGVVNAWVYESMHRKLQQIEQLSNELGKDLLATIKQGEGPFLEFKSSFRWDIQQSRVNRTLENAVLKTLAGYMNSSNGGTLLIGVADDGQTLGLQNDYQSLKRKNNDGFEQAVMTAISNNIGADLCANVQVLFHVVDEKEICRLIVSPASRAVFLSQGNSQKFYLRTGGGTRGLNIKEASEFIANRWVR